MIRILFYSLLLSLFLSCTSNKNEFQSAYFIGVSGSQPVDSMGLTLIHEHMLVDFIGADSVSTTRYDRDSVISKVLPYLLDAKRLGVETILECTPSFLGKDPLLLKSLSEQSGIEIVTNTGLYGAVDGKYLPEYAFSESAEQLAKRWILDFERGIEGTGIKPGFIKISVNAETPLRAIDAKLVQAAGISHQNTGLQIASHTGPWFAAEEQVSILQKLGVKPSAFVWVHAQNEEDQENFKKAAEMGVWISWDGIGWEVDSYIERLLMAKENGFLDQVLISHDAGWYKPGEINGGDFQPFTPIFTELIPALSKRGFTEKDWKMLLIDNPQRAFGIQKD